MCKSTMSKFSLGSTRCYSSKTILGIRLFPRISASLPQPASFHPKITRQAASPVYLPLNNREHVYQLIYELKYHAHILYHSAWLIYGGIFTIAVSGQEGEAAKFYREKAVGSAPVRVYVVAAAGLVVGYWYSPFEDPRIFISFVPAQIMC